MKSFPRWLIVAFGLTMLALIVGGYWFYLYQEQAFRENTEANLQAAAKLKVNQIAEWRFEKLRDAEAFTASPLLTDAVDRWLANPQPDLAEKILSQFRSIKEIFHYLDVMLVDRDGQVRLGLSNHHGALHEEAAHSVVEALREGGPVMTDLHAGPTDLPPHIDVVAPLFSETGNTKDPIGAVILQINARQFLYPLIQVWPTPSVSAETLLVRKEGEAVLFLNDLRHQPDTALKLRIPLSKKNVPAVMAVLGKEGIVQGTDYRGVEVLSVLKAIPNSPWFMVSKVDEAEVLAGWRFRSILILVLVIALLAFLFTAVGVVWQDTRKAHYKELFRAERALRKVEEGHRITLMSVGDGIISTDVDGRVEILNPVAEALTGWRQEEARGKPLEEVFRIFNEETRQPVKNPVSKVLKEGLVVGLANHTVIQARDGTERPIADSAAPIRDEDGIITGVVLVFRDQFEQRAAQRLLTQEKEKAQQYLDISGVMLIALNTNGHVTLVNRKGCEILGYQESDVLGKDWFEHFLPDKVRDEVKGTFSRIIAGYPEMDEYVENVVLTSSGEARLIAWHNSILRDQDGSIMGTLSSGEDITERKRVEQALRESEERYKSIFNNAGIGIDVVDGKGRLLQVNRSLAQMLGYTEEELLNLTILDITHPEDIGESQDRFQKMVIGETDAYRFEKRYLRKDGAVVWADVSESAVRGTEGVHEATIGVISDITLRKRAEDELFVAKRDWEDTFNSINDMITIHDKDFNIIHCNTAAKRLLGLPNPVTSDVIKCYQYYHGKGCPPETCPSCRCLQTQQQAVSELFEPHLNMFLEITAIPRFDKEGHLAGLVHIVRDFTERKQLQKQLQHAQKMEAVGTLAGGIAHDFNNLLHVVLGYSELVIGDEALPGRLKGDLERVFLAARKGADLVQGLLTFSRKVEPKPLILDLNQRIRQTENFLERTIPKMIHIEMVLADDLDRIHADPTQIEQVLMNLAVNARDAMPDGGRLVIETANVFLDEESGKALLGVQPGEYVLLSVSDTGYGMDKETLDHIFEPFYTTKEVGKGTGLGLSMVYGIVHQHGGHITCYSEPGKGTTFKIYFPAVEMEMNSDVAATGIMPAFGTETILLVDDEDLVRDLGKRVLERSGYTVLTAANGKEALELYKKERDKISLVILDLIMPEMGGKQCLEELLKIDPKARVLIASGYSAEGEAKGALGKGARGFVGKPYNMKGMLRSVREVLDSE
jgi:two-component system cell cycle sensor histidine kinase/response regulator CckA